MIDEDIVEWLRCPDWAHRPRYSEAAEEIEQLRVQVGRMALAIEAGEAEIAQLRAANADLLAALKALSKDHDEFWGAQPGGWKSADEARAVLAKAEALANQAK
jgi:hypothetical protein